ncbi:MAG: Gfo/Idh/MocA family protein, partial [Armatimonadota bacterium]
MAYRCAFLGCGPRAGSHARAYQHITRGQIVACCDLNEQRLQEFGDEWEIENRYVDFEKMIAEQKPDVVHMVTPPTIRVSLMSDLAGAGVPAVIVEKPICIGADDYKRLRRLNAQSDTRFTVNHQLRYHPMILDLLQQVRDGDIGQVRCIDASCVLPMSGQGVHVLDLMFAFNDYTQAQTIFGASSGYNDINGTHPSPRSAAWMLTFNNGVRAMLQAGEGAPEFEPGPRHMHKRIAVYGTHGFVHWRMNAWERSVAGGEVETGEKEYREEDTIGQANLTNAVFD